MKILTTSEIRDVDVRSCAVLEINSFQLMFMAASAVANRIMERWPVDGAPTFYVFAGPGNNGGDALVVLSILLAHGYNAKGFLAANADKLSTDCVKALSLVPKDGVCVISTQAILPMLQSGDVVIDGLFGSGLNRPLTGGYAYMVDFINNSPAFVVSIDIPSGLMGENNATNDLSAVIHASLTYTFTAPKLSMLFAENESFVGEFEVVDFGLPKSVVEASPSIYNLIEARELKSLLHRRSKFGHKGTYGNAALVAGSRGMMGAALMASKAALRAGAGLLTAIVPECGYSVMQTSVPEAKCLTQFQREHCISSLPASLDYGVWAIGPGLGLAAETWKALDAWLSAASRPLVLDADALNAMAAHPSMLRKLKRNTILTPHVKEADRLIAAARKEGLFANCLSQGCDGDDGSSYSRLQKILFLVRRLEIIVVLKGTYTAVCCPDGSVYFNTEHGNPGMAVGGSGDVLTGIILGLLAQHYTPKEAAMLGVYLHALAGDVALEDQSEESLLPTDLISCIGKAYNRLRATSNRKNGSSSIVYSK